MSVQDERPRPQAEHAVKTMSEEAKKKGLSGKWIKGWKILRRVWLEGSKTFVLKSQLAEVIWKPGVMIAQPAREASGYTGGVLGKDDKGNERYGHHVLMRPPAELLRPLKSVDTKETGEILCPVYCNADKVVIVGVDSGSAGGTVETWVSHETKILNEDYEKALRGEFNPKPSAELKAEVKAMMKRITPEEAIEWLTSGASSAGVVPNLTMFEKWCKAKADYSRERACTLYSQVKAKANAKLTVKKAVKAVVKKPVEKKVTIETRILDSDRKKVSEKAKKMAKDLVKRSASKKVESETKGRDKDATKSKSYWKKEIAKSSKTTCTMRFMDANGVSRAEARKFLDSL